MFSYGDIQRGDHPGPEVELVISSAAKPDAGVRIRCLIDSGAGATCIPVAAAEAFDKKAFSPKTKVRVSGASGEETLADAMLINVKLPEFFEVQVKAVVLKKKYGLIGRDVLKALIVRLDGPNQSWRLEDNE